MEYLKDFQWYQRVPDSETFITNEDVLDNSVSFKILKAKFQNPLLDTSSEESEPPTEKKIVNSRFNSKKQSKNHAPLSDYIPGLCKLPLYPEISKLSPDQQKICIKVLQSLNKYCITMPKLTVTDQEQHIFNNLIPLINEERQLFSNFVKNIWSTVTCGRHLKLLDKHEILIENILEKHKNAYKKYPQFYQIASMLPLVYNNNIPIEITFICDLHESNELRLVNLPTLKNRFIVPIDLSCKENTLGPVSEDSQCERLALEHKASIVISSNGLKTLANNQPPFSQFWDLPIFIKEYKMKDSQNKPYFHNIVYIDRAIPHCKLTNKEKSFKCFKYLLKKAFLNSENICYNNSTQKNIDMDCEFDSNKTFDILDENPPDVDDDEFSDNLFIDETDKSVSDTASICENEISKSDNQNTSLNSKHSNNTRKLKIERTDEKSSFTKPFTTYNLWKIGQTKGKNLLSKDLEEDIKFIVRCKIDGYEVDSQGIKQTLNIVPKIEYQNEFGSEMNTPTENAHQWSLLQFRPQSKIIKARIIAHKGEVIMIEKIPLVSVANETTNQGSWKPELALGCYFNMFSKLRKLQSGNYILRHDPKSHAFAILYNAVQTKCENGLDLQESYQCLENFITNQTAPWTPIDPSIVTPNLVHHKVMPCMFTPGKCKILRQNTKQQEKVNNPNNQNKCTKKKMKKKKMK